MRKFIITEEEKYRILNLYKEKKLIIEGETPSGFVLNLSDTFRMGYYTQLSDMGQTQLNNELNALKNYLKKNKDSRFIVNITAGESQVTNRDVEGGGTSNLPVGDLAKKRADSIKQKLTQFFQTLIDNNTITIMPTFSEHVIKIGQTEYPKNGTQQEKERAKIENAEKYKKEQFINVTLSIDKTITPDTPSIPKLKTHREPNAYMYEKYYYGVDQWIKERSEISGFTVSNSNMLLTRNQYFGLTNPITLKNSRIIESFNIKIIQDSNPQTFKDVITVPYKEKRTYKPTDSPGKNIKQTIRYAETYKLLNEINGELNNFQWSFAKYYLTRDDAEFRTNSWGQISNKPQIINDISSYF
jgi:hypothetical protein